MKLLALAFALTLNAAAQICGPAPACVCTGCLDFGPSATAPPGYETLQYGKKLSYSMSGLAPGLYQVTLVWWDPSYQLPGLRLMSLTANDLSVATNLDVAAMGGGMTSHSTAARAFMAPVIDGTLTVVLTPTRGTNAILSKLRIVPFAGGGGGPAPAGDLYSSQLAVTRVGPTQLSVSAGNVGIGGITFLIPATLVDVQSGTGAVRLGVTSGGTPYLQSYASRGLVTTCKGGGGCTASIEAAQFGEGDIQIATWYVTNGEFDANGYTDLRAPLSNGTRILTGPGMRIVPSGHQTTIGINTDVLPLPQ